MAFNPFASVSDYPGMLNKIATYTFVAALLAVWLLRATLSAVDVLLQPLNLQLPLLSGLTLPLGTILPAFLLAFLSRVLKFHDRLSDVLGIRQRFDVEAILFPLALGSGVELDGAGIREMRRDREQLMYKAFYKYASSSPGRAVIDAHYTTMALDQWSWYWIVLEVTTISLTLAIVFMVTAHNLSAAVLLLAVLVGLGLLSILRPHCVNYALQETEAILANRTSKDEIARAFRALSGRRS